MRDDKIDYTSQEPWIYREHPVPHYYGDTVRQLILFSAAALLVGAPFYASDLAAELPVIVLSSLVLVCLAAFTSPVSRTVLMADAVAAGVGMVLFEYWALAELSNTSLVAVGLRQAIALVLMFALYFAGKTLRGLSEPEWTEDNEEEKDESASSDDEGASDSEYSERELRESFEDKED